MCNGRELDRDVRRDDEQVLEEIRRLFARYRDLARRGAETEADETPQTEAEQPEAAVPAR